MNRLAQTALLSIFIGGCGSGQTQVRSEDTTSDVQMSCVAPGELNAETCGFVASGCCYATAELACRAAGCPAAGCTIRASFPAQVHCS